VSGDCHARGDSREALHPAGVREHRGRFAAGERAGARLPISRREFECRMHGPPDLLGVPASIKGFLSRQSRKFGQMNIPRPRARVTNAERLIHALPEVREAHGKRSWHTASHRSRWL